MGINCVSVTEWNYNCGKDKPQLIVLCLFKGFPRILVSEGRLYEGNLWQFVTNDDSVVVCSGCNKNWCNSPRRKERMMMKSMNDLHLTYH